MAIIKSYTDIEQSCKLANILPPESADMSYCAIHNIGQETHYNNIPIFVHATNKDIPCWSLAALLSVLPAECECMSLEHINYGNNHKKYFMHYVVGENTEDYDNPVDACVAMIEKLHELNLL